MHTTILTRRAFAALFFASALALPAAGRDVTDATGRTVVVPDTPKRVFAAGPPAAVLLYALKPEAMIGWPRKPGPADLPYLTPAAGALPELGRLTGRGGTANLEVLLSAKPDLIIDFGTVSKTYRTLADQVQAQTGIPYVLIDGSFANTPTAIRQLADYAEDTLKSVDEGLTKVPLDKRPRVYLARGPQGLESAGPRSINAEIIGRSGATNVVESSSGGFVTASPEQILTWAPDTIVTVDPAFASTVAAMPDWASVPAVRERRIFLAPAAPFGFIDSPPSINRLIGLRWLMHKLYPTEATGDLDAEVKEFYGLFYHVTLDDAAVRRLLSE